MLLDKNGNVRTLRETVHKRIETVGDKELFRVYSVNPDEEERLELFIDTNAIITNCLADGNEIQEYSLRSFNYKGSLGSSYEILLDEETCRVMMSGKHESNRRMFKSVLSDTCSKIMNANEAYKYIGLQFPMRSNYLTVTDEFIDKILFNIIMKYYK